MFDWKGLALNARALVFGFLVAVVMCTAYVYAEAKIAEQNLPAGSHMMMTAEDRACFAAIASGIFAIIIVAVSAPIWVLLKRYRLENAFAAALVGFFVTLGIWVGDNWSPTNSLFELIRSGIIWAVCGAIAGLATWWARPVPRMDR